MNRKSPEQRESDRILNRLRGLRRTAHKHAPSDQEYQGIIAKHRAQENTNDQHSAAIVRQRPSTIPVFEKPHPKTLSKKVFPK